MTTTPRASGVAPRGSGFVGAVAAEWTKLWGLRSTWLCLAATVVMAAGVAVLGIPRSPNGFEGDPPILDANSNIQAVMLLAQFAMVALAALPLTGEYATGAIRTTLTCVPRRATMLLAKVTVGGAVAALTGIVMGLLNMGVIAALYGPQYMEITAEGLGRGLLGAGFYLLTISLFVLGLGAILRSTAGAITTAIGVIVGIPLLSQIIGNETLTEISNYTPTQVSGVVLSGVTAMPYSLGSALLLLLGWAIVALAGGYAVLRYRDA
ncbi:ABC transporter permease subunit [Salinactinospora qingdaonensis]|uniref:ABC transporter permease n=1 Tax=Salinactinospora qingdaonensis TaxID=702744 RepID=A0ABP7FEF4_9ACTN